jgi:hypothetical protein
METIIRRFLLVTVISSLGFLGPSVSAQVKENQKPSELLGNVSDAAENAPIKYAYVLVHNGSDKKDIIAKLDERGRFSLVLTPGLYDIFVTAEGFSPICKKIEISAGHATTYKARLKPDEDHLQSNAR